jgi:uncharacterized protein (TIGR02099 family)
MNTVNISKHLHRLYFTIAVVIIVFAVLVTALRLLTPIAGRYKPDIEQWATLSLGNSVVIGDIVTGWHNLSPVIELKNIDISGFHIDSVRISVSMLRSLWHQKLIFNQLIFDGMHISVQQDAQQQWHLEGLLSRVNSNKPLATSQNTSAISWLLAQHELAVQNLSADIKLKDYPSHTIHNLKLILRNSGTHHNLRGQIIFNDRQHSTVDLAANIVGEPRSFGDLHNLQAKIYLSANQLNLANWLGTDTYYGVHVAQGTLAFQLWGSWQQQHLQSVAVTFNLQNLLLQALVDPAAITIPHFSGNARWQVNPEQGWQFTADNLQLTLNQHPWPVNKLGYFVKKTPQGEQQSAQLDFIQLQDLIPLATHLSFIPNSIQKQLKNYNPQGQLKNIQITHEGPLSNLKHFQAMATLQNVGTHRVGNLPGVQHLSADINITPESGSVKLNSTDTSFDFGSLFPMPLTLQKLNGIIQWQKNSQGVVVQGLQLDLQHPNLSLQSNFSLLVPEQGAPRMRLLAQFKETDVSKVGQFLPVSLLAPSAVQWLDQAFVSGDGLQGSMVLSGSLNKFPFFHGEGQFIVHSTLKNIQLHFAPDWPTIDHINGALTFTKRAMYFKLAQGDLYQLPIKQLTAKIPDMGQDPQAYLTINGDIDLPNTARAEQFIFNSPLRDSVGKNLAGINLQGAGDLHLKLTIPLKEGDPITEGQLNLRANTLTIPSLKLTFSQLTGLINFTDSGLSSPLLMANFFQQPMTLSIRTTHQRGERFTAFDINSMLNMHTVEQYFTLPKLDFLTGATCFNAHLTLNSNNDATLKIRTDLEGVAVDLPKPFAKTAEIKTPFTVDMKLMAGAAPKIKISYENLWKLFLSYQKQNAQNKLETVVIHFGPGIASLPTTSGIYVQGMLRHFYWDEWQPVLQKYIFTKTNATTSEPAALQLEDINLFIDRLTGFKQIVEQAEIHVTAGSTAWTAQLVSPQIDGQLVIPHAATSPYVGQFKTLYLRALTKGGGDVNQFDPANMIPINIHADNFQYGTKNYGAVTLQAHPIANGMQIQQLQITNSDLSLSTSGSWTRVAGKDVSSFTGELSTDNLGKLLLQQEVTDHMSGGKGQVNFILSWSASPADFTAKILRGDVTLDFKNGAIIGLSQSTNEKIGVGRVLNALSIQNIYDRLTFQNKSIDSDGFNFNEMKGTLTFKNGDIFTNDAYINGQVAQIYINGRIGLNKEDFDLLIKVIPYLTSSLPVIATIVGTPVLGAITWAADKVVNAGIEKMVVYQYRITGPWEDPVVVPVSK